MDPAFDADRDAVLEHARSAGVSGLILVGYDLATSRAAIDLARRTPGTRASVGIHPNYAAAATEADFDAIAQLARSSEVVAIGETGLDYYRHHTPPERQRDAFEWHLRLAARTDLPVVVHNREADADIARLTRNHAVRGILHCFSSTDQTYLDGMLEADFHVSFAGTLTFKNAGPLRAIAQRVPLDRVLIETDCPYLAPEPHRGRRNEPAYVRETAVCLADVRGISLEALTDAVWANSLRVFRSLAAEPVA
jgi:TatD DNase family protein